jgi:hypothetical protein
VLELALTDPAVLPFILIPVALVLLLLWGVAAASVRLGEPPETRRRVLLWTAIIAIAWMAITWFVAARGTLRMWDATPPPLGILFIAILVLAARIAFGSYGRRLVDGLPLWTLVAVQSFRFPLETAMHALYEQGIMPAQMSYSGRNFDIVTGITALVVALLVRRGHGGRVLVAAWNVMGFALLLNIVSIALASTPRFRYFGDEQLNTFVADPPFVWLPSVMVLTAFAGHLLVFRALVRRAPVRPTR